MLSFLFSIVPNWPLILMFVGVVSRLAFAPIQRFVFDQQRKLQEAKPEIDKLSREDARLFLTESARIKRTHGVKESWLLFATVAQIPVFIWLYRAIRENSALANVGFAWIPSLGHADPFFVLPLLAAVLALWSASSSHGFKMTSYLQSAVTFALIMALPAGVAIYSIAAQLTQLALQSSFQKLT